MLIDGWVDNERVPAQVVLGVAHAVSAFREALHYLASDRDPHLEHYLHEILSYLHDPHELYLQEMQEHFTARYLGRLDVAEVVLLQTALRELATAIHQELHHMRAWDDTGTLWLDFDQLIGNDIVLRRVGRDEACQIRDVPDYGLP